MKKNLKLWLQHRLNSGHLYCRLRDLGIGKSKAIWICKKVEPIINRKLYA